MFLSLTLVTIALFLLTWLLFGSFTSHRVELAKRWSARGQQDLSSGNAEPAVTDFRTALTYEPHERSYELLLAQALGDAGHTDEAYAYFLNLWEAEPGNGLINLQLARLSAKKNDKDNTIRYYRAAIYGTWEGDGAMRRREVRLELVRYLIGQHNLGAARNELLIAAGNAPEDPAVRLEIAQLMEQAGALDDALRLCQKITAVNPDNQAALAAGGRVAFQLGYFATARSLLEKALKGAPTAQSERLASVRQMLEDSRRVLELYPDPVLPSHERASRIQEDLSVAKARFDTCNAKLLTTGASPAPVQLLAGQWSAADVSHARSKLEHSPEMERTLVQLIYDTELITRQYCGAPTGADALLLSIAKSPETVER